VVGGNADFIEVTQSSFETGVIEMKEPSIGAGVIKAVIEVKMSTTEDSSDMLETYAKNEEKPHELLESVDLQPLVSAVNSKKRIDTSSKRSSISSFF